MTLLWCGHVYKCSYRVIHCELCEWPVREAARHAGQSRIPRFDGADGVYPQALRSIPPALPSRVHEMWALHAPVSAEPTGLTDLRSIFPSRLTTQPSDGFLLARSTANFDHSEWPRS